LLYFAIAQVKSAL